MPGLQCSTHIVSALALLALLSGSVAPLSATSLKTPLPRPDSPVRCHYDGAENDRLISSRQKRTQFSTARVSRPMTTSASPSIVMRTAPPPPPPAPPPRLAQSVAPASALATLSAPERFSKPQPETRERYTGKEVEGVKSTAAQPVSTFSVDVDTGSYANVRRFLNQGGMPPAAAVRTEEMLNYFRYDYPTPADRSQPFAVSTDMALTPWNSETRLLRIGIKGFDLPKEKRPPTNLVFLVDVSGSMSSPDKLPLVRSALSMLADRMGPQDRISIVVYAGAAGIVLEPTNRPDYVKAALECLEAGGSTAGGQGMELAYATARAHFIKGGVNRVIMATDGDFNVGISSNEGIETIVKKNRESGISLTCLGFGQGNYNEAMMERIADVGNGNYAYIDSLIEAVKVLDQERDATLFTIAKDVKIQIEFNPTVVKEYRLIGYENRALAEEDFNNDQIDAGDIGAGHQVTALYELVPANGTGWLPARRYAIGESAPAPTNVNELAWLKLRYKLPDGDRSRLIEQPLAATLIANARAPQDDMAFVVAVAAFGQKLRNDKYLGNFGYADISKLAGTQRGYLREEFVKLAALAGLRDASTRQTN